MSALLLSNIACVLVLKFDILSAAYMLSYKALTSTAIFYFLHRWYIHSCKIHAHHIPMMSGIRFCDIYESHVPCVAALYWKAITISQATMYGVTKLVCF